MALKRFQINSSGYGYAWSIILRWKLGYLTHGGLALSYYTTVTSWISGSISGMESFQSSIYFSAVGFGCHVFFTNPSFLWNNAAPNSKKFPFLFYSHSLPCVHKTHDAQILRCNCVLTLCIQDMGTKNSCVLHLASCTGMYTRTHGDRQHWENDQNRNY